MRREFLILNGLVLTLLVPTLLGSVWHAFRARRRGVDLGPGFAPTVVGMTAGLLLSIAPLLRPVTPAWVDYALLFAAIFLLGVAVGLGFSTHRRPMQDSQNEGIVRGT